LKVVCLQKETSSDLLFRLAMTHNTSPSAPCILGLLSAVRELRVSCNATKN